MPNPEGAIRQAEGRSLVEIKAVHRKQRVEMGHESEEPIVYRSRFSEALMKESMDAMAQMRQQHEHSAAMQMAKHNQAAAQLKVILAGRSPKERKKKLPFSPKKTDSPWKTAGSAGPRVSSAFGALVKREKPLDDSTKAKVVRTFTAAATKAPKGDALLEELGKHAVGGRVSDRKLVELARKVWKLPAWELNDETISSLCANLDTENSGTVELRKFVELVSGKTLSEEQAAKLQGKPGEGEHLRTGVEEAEGEEVEQAEEKVEEKDETNDEDPGDLAASQPRGRVRFEDAPLPKPDEVTRLYLNSNPSFILKVIKAKEVELCLIAIERMSQRGMNQTDLRGCTALHLAAEVDLGSVCHALLNRASFIGASAQDYQGWTALHRGARCGSVEACRELLLHPRFTEVNTQEGKDGWNALHLAAMHGHVEVVKVLLADPRFTGHCDGDKWGRTPLHAAAEHGRKEECQAMMLCERISMRRLLTTNKWSQTAMVTAQGGPDGPVANIMRAAIRTREASSGSTKV